MKRRVLVVVLALLALLLALGAAWWAGAANGGSTPTASRTAAPGEISRQMVACMGTAAGQEGVYQPAVDCFKTTLRHAIEYDRFDEVLAMSQKLAESDSYAACHNAGHQLGMALIAEGRSMDEVLLRMFKGRPQPTEYVCATPLVHGLVQGNVAGEPPYDMDYLAQQCVDLEKVEPRYANECAHYYGHATWKTIEGISPMLGELCSKLSAAVEGDAVNSCMGGAVMTKYGLQEGYGIEDQVAQLEQPPAYEEAIHLCDPLEGDTRIYKACWGGIGWLLANRATHTLKAIPRGDDAAGNRDAIAEYVRAVSFCTGRLCMENFVTHFDIQDYHNGIVPAVCASPDLGPSVDVPHFWRICDILMKQRTGTGMPGSAPPGWVPET